MFLTDFFIKSYFQNHPFKSFPVINNIFHITVVFNKGAAFGILKGKTNFLIYLSIIFLIILLLVFYKERQKRFIISLGYGLVLGGALSNLFDRVVYGYVIDYLDFRIWPVFNLSDTCITLGVFLIILDSLREKYAKRPLHHQ